MGKRGPKPLTGPCADCGTDSAGRRYRNPVGAGVLCHSCAQWRRTHEGPRVGEVTLTCQDCPRTFSWVCTGKRGALPKLCPDCRRRRKLETQRKANAKRYAVGRWSQAQHTHIRRAQEAGVPWEDFDLGAVMRQFGDRCAICGREVDHSALQGEPLAPTVEHIVPLSRGGGHLIVNVVLACCECNRAKRTEAWPILGRGGRVLPPREPGDPAIGPLNDPAGLLEHLGYVRVD